MYNHKGELAAVLAFQTQVGQRRYGHYDHDSHGVVGPMKSARSLRTPQDGSQNFAAESSSYTGIRIKLVRVPETGEIIRTE